MLKDHCAHSDLVTWFPASSFHHVLGRLNQPSSVQHKEGEQRSETAALVASNSDVIAGKRLRRCLLIETPVGAPPHAPARTAQRRLEQCRAANVDEIRVQGSPCGRASECHLDYGWHGGLVVNGVAVWLDVGADGLA